MKRLRIPIYLVLLLVLSACKPFPKDANRTLNNVQNKVLKVGITLPDSSPDASRRTQDLEISLINNFARELNAQVEWVRGSQSDIINLLHYNKLHMAIGGYTSPSPFETKVSFTRPYLTEKIMIGVPAAHPVPEEIKGKTVMVNTHLTAMYVEKKKGIPVMLDSLIVGNHLVAASENELKRLNLNPTEILLHKEDFVIAVPHGENGFLIKLEHLIDKYGRSK